ncbi:MAG: DUF4381 domain-containing protein [Gammaproteobacteria bacterium]|nr:DUF4381 domain-containing protein [Gammaproteobacteria bacterium]
MNPSQLELRDIHLPGDIIWWPLAFGPWLLGAALLGLIIVVLLRYRRLGHHRAACRSLREAIDAIETGADPSACVLQASTTLRRFAMTIAQDSAEVAGLVGERWLAYLDDCWERSSFSDGPGQLVLSSPYRASGGLAVEESLELCRLCVAWVRAQPPRR